jgi:hypothetical protein
LLGAVSCCTATLPPESVLALGIAYSAGVIAATARPPAAMIIA